MDDRNKVFRKIEFDKLTAKTFLYRKWRFHQSTMDHLGMLLTL